MAQVTNGGLIPTPKHVEAIPFFTEKVEMVNHAIEVARLSNDPQYKSIVANFAGAICMQMGHEMRVNATYQADLSYHDALVIEGQMMVNQGRVIRDAVMQ